MEEPQADKSSDRVWYFLQESSTLSTGLYHKIPGYDHTSFATTSAADRPHQDLFWTAFNANALYNTFFKIIFIGSSGYVVYLMLNDYKPTQDPNTDTFKVEYLLGASAVLGILFTYKYTPSEVRGSIVY